ncbi:MAG: hypothetical protein U0W40_10635 [Acidimicrobiia bacterium]
MADAEVEVEDNATPATPAAPVRKHRVRRIFTALLVIVACVLAPLSVVALWAKTTVLDTDNYVSTVSSLASNKDVQDAIATRITDKIMSQQDLVDQLEGKLPKRITDRLPKVQDAAHQFVYEASLKFLQSSQFQKLWDNANRRVQAQAVAALTGDTGKLKLKNDGTVTLDLSGVAKEIRSRLEARGLSLDRVPPGTIDTSIVLFKWPWLGTVQDGVNLLADLAWFLPFLTLLFFAGGIALSVHRRKTVIRSGIGLSIGMFVILAGLAIGRGPYLDLFPKAEGKKAGGAAYDDLLHGLRLEARGIFVLGIVIALAAWLIGRSPAKTNSAKAIRIGVIAVGCLALAALDPLTGLGVLIVAGVVAIVLVLLEVLNRRHAQPAVDDPVPDEVSS